MNLEAFGGPGRLPRTQEAARQAAGANYVKKGVVPWIIQERYQDLVAAFRSRDAAAITQATAVLGHYIGDAHVPLHTTLDHDGKTTDQVGVHSRWESGLVGRMTDRDQLSVRAAQADAQILQRPWQWLEAAHALVPRLLADDAAADRTTPRRGHGKGRGPAYWALFREAQEPMVRRQLQAAAEHLGDAVLSAWVEAGRPTARP